MVVRINTLVMFNRILQHQFMMYRLTWRNAGNSLTLKTQCLATIKLVAPPVNVPIEVLIRYQIPANSVKTIVIIKSTKVDANEFT